MKKKDILTKIGKLAKKEDSNLKAVRRLNNQIRRMLIDFQPETDNEAKLMILFLKLRICELKEHFGLVKTE